MSPANTYTAVADREPRCRTCLPGRMREYHLNRHLLETSSEELQREIRGAYANNGVTIEALAEMYGVTELRIRRMLRPQLERRLQERLDALPKAARAELLHVLMMPDPQRAERIGDFWSYPQSRTFAELLIDCEEDRTLRAVLIGMLRENYR